MGVEQLDSYQTPEVGLVEDVSLLTRGGVLYSGYKITLDGQTIYVTWEDDKIYRIGGEVDL